MQLIALLSILMGLVVAWLTRRWQYGLVGRDSAFLLIVFLVAVWVSFVEPWVGGAYHIEFVIFVVILLPVRASFVLTQKLRTTVYS